MTTALSARPKLRIPAILDEYGKPIETPIIRRRVAPANPRGMQTYSDHPEIGLTVETLASYHRQAEDGRPVRQFDMWDGLIERHADLRGMLNDRNEDVAGCEWYISPPPGRTDKASVNAARALGEQLQNQLQFRQFISHMLTAVPYGIACANMVWDYVEKIVTPVEFSLPAARRFASPDREHADQVMLIDGDSFKLIPLQAGLWACSRYRHRNPWAAGLMRSCDWWTLFALTGFRDFNVFADMFGLPIAVGYYEEGAGGASRIALEDAVKSIGQDGYAVLSALTELVVKERSSGGDSWPWPDIISICEAQLTKLITGGTLNTDVSSTGAGSYNAATVHAARSYKMKLHDARCVEEMFVRDIGTPFIAWNGFDRAAPPMLKIKLTRDELARAQTVEILGMGMTISKSQVREEFGLREPSGPEDEMTFQPTEAPDPNRARQEKKR